MASLSVPPAVRRVGFPLLRCAGAVAVLVLAGWHVGGAPFRDGLRAVTLPDSGAAAAVIAATTVCSAWRWRVVARALDVAISLPAAVGAYYRSQLLNSVLPGGVLGDVHRAVAHGRRAGDLGGGLRAVAWERLAGQAVQIVIAAVALLAAPSPLRVPVSIVLACVAGVALCAAVVVRAAAWWEGSRVAAAARTAGRDLRRLLAPTVWPQLVPASVLAVAGYTTVFVLAARAAGCAAPLGELVALVMLVQAAMAIPLSVGGWGIREGAAAWAFGAAGLGAGTGVTVTTVFGVLSLAALAPGAILLGADAARRMRVPVRRTLSAAPVRPRGGRGWEATGG